jgi:NADP-dependent 3-hydroxy acid dehydrogenase YdfG
MSGRVAVITGGGSGIGAATARALAADGWTVVIAGRRAEALDEVAAGDDRIDIGNAATTMATGSVAGTPQADGGIRPEPVMDVAEAARAVRYMASLPLDANVLTMTVMATRMPYVGRG